MGQMTLGLLFGAEAPALPSTEEYEDPLEDLLDRFHTEAGIAVYESWDNEEPRITGNYEGERSLVGVWVAVGGSGNPAAPYFLDQALPLETLTSFYAEALVKAQTLWDAFASYCTAQEHITLASPTLWITPTEVA